MKNNYIYMILSLIILTWGCEKDREIPDFSQPIVDYTVDKDTYTIGSETITTGPIKDYEQGSEVVYRIQVSSTKNLSHFTVTNSSDAFSQESKVINTEPSGVVDDEGNFTEDLKNVVIYYSYKIHPLINAGTSENVNFTFFNKNNRSTVASHSFKVIKAGSTNGELLKVIDLSYTNNYSNGIGMQDNLDFEYGGTRPYASNTSKRGPMFSFKYGISMKRPADAVEHADEIDFVGYRTRYAGKDPVLTNNRYYLCSPSDTAITMNSYGGARAVIVHLSGTNGTVEISFAGVTMTADFDKNTSTIATNLVIQYRDQYKALGYNFFRSSNKLYWDNLQPVGTISDVKVKTISGNLTAVEENNRNTMYIVQMRKTMRAMAKKLQEDGKDLRVVYFKRLDDLDGPDQLSPEEFDILTHDNEFDTYLEGIEEEGMTHAQMELNQVWGFVMSDGKRGLLRTSPTTVFVDGVDKGVPSPYSSYQNLYGVIKYQEN